MSDRHRRLTLIALLAAALVPYFVGLGDSSIWDANEAFYVETPREMIESGDYVSPTFNYEPRLNKPVLSYWMVAALYHLFGVSVGVERLAIAIGAVGLIAVACGLAWLAGAARTTSRADAALWAAIGLALTPRLLMFARRILIDIYISLFMALALLCFAAAERYPVRRRLFLVGMYAAVGLGMLTKGPVAAVVPALVFAAYLAFHKELRRVTDMMIPAGLAIVLAIVAPWYAALYRRHGWSPIVSFFVGENVDRFTSGLGVRVERGAAFYFPVIFSDSFPWAIYLLPAAVIWLRERGAPSWPQPDARIRSLLWLWVIVTVGFFSLSAGKQDLYIFPIVPAVAVLAANAFTRSDDGTAERGAPLLLAWTTGALGVILLFIGAGLLYVLRTSGATYAIDGIATVGAIGITSGALVIWFAFRRLFFAALTTVAVAFVALNSVFVLRTLPSFEAYKPVPKFAAAINQRAGPDDVIATYDQAMPSLVFYLRRHVVVLFDRETLVEALNTTRVVYAVMSDPDYEAIRGRLPAVFCVIERRPTFDVRLRNILARTPLPELVLITNRCEG